MSKAVKSVGRAISKVVKGAVSAVKKIATSKLGKVVIAAAAIYFGGAALMGAMGGASAGTGFMGTLSGAIQGAGAGISSAWSGITGAAGALTGGQGLSAAGTSLSGGFTGAYGAGSSAVSGALAGASAPTVQTAAQMGSSFAKDMAAAGVQSTPSSGSGLISGAWNAMGDRSKAALISGGSQLVGGVVQGIGQQKAMEDQRNYEAQQAQLARDRYNQNVGTKLWGDAPTVDTGYSGPSTLNNYDPVAEARAIADRRRAEFEAQYPTTGIVARGMQFAQPTAGNGFPVYNPYYFRG